MRKRFRKREMFIGVVYLVFMIAVNIFKVVGVAREYPNGT